MKKIKLISGLLLIFVLGGVTGIFGMSVYYKYRIIHPGPDRTPGMMGDRVLERLSKDLDLNEKQYGEIAEIIDLTGNRIATVMKRYMPELREINRQSFELMKEKLNPEQKEELEKIEQKIQKGIERRIRRTSAH